MPRKFASPTTLLHILKELPSRAHPYERHPVRFATTPPRRQPMSLEPEPVRSSPSNNDTSAEVLNSLVSAIQDPETFEATASSIFEAHDVEPSVAAALMRLTKPKRRTVIAGRPVERCVGCIFQA